jgi:hypothetical protein
MIKKFWRLCQITWRKPFYSLRFKLTSFCKIDLTELKDSIVQKVNDFWCLEAIKEWENWENKRTLNRFHFENQAKLQYMNSHTICALLASNFNIIHLIFSTGKQFETFPRLKEVEIHCHANLVHVIIKVYTTQHVPPQTNFTFGAHRGFFPVLASIIRL